MLPNKNLLKFKKLFEKNYPLVISSILTILSLFCFSKHSEFHTITSKLLSDSMLTLIVSIEAAMFGFLLTILALIFQMNNKMTDLIKEFKRFNDLIRFSKVAVYSSLVIVFLSLALILFITPGTNTFLMKSVKYFFGFSLIYNFLSTIRFVSIFYLIAKSK